MPYSLPAAQAFKADFTYLIGTQREPTGSPEAHIVKGIVVVADDGACIHELMQIETLQRALGDDAFLIRKQWVFTYRVYLIYVERHNSAVLFYQELALALDQLEIDFDPRKYQL